MVNLTHSASFHPLENSAPTKPGIKHLEHSSHTSLFLERRSTDPPSCSRRSGIGCDFTRKKDGVTFDP
jgi:hypothetical protein